MCRPSVHCVLVILVQHLHQYGPQMCVTSVQFVWTTGEHGAIIRQEHQMPWYQTGRDRLVPQHWLHCQENPAVSKESPSPASSSYIGTIERILSSCITIWFRNRITSDQESLQRIIRTAEKIIAVSPPCITDIYTKCCNVQSHQHFEDPTHLLKQTMALGTEALGPAWPDRHSFLILRD